MKISFREVNMRDWITAIVGFVLIGATFDAFEAGSPGWGVALAILTFLVIMSVNVNFERDREPKS